MTTPPPAHPFVSSIRVLFDILDVNKSGYVFLSDIEQYWEADDDVSSSQLPYGVVDCLRQVADRNDLLGFDDFVRGLQMAMDADKPDSRQAGGVKITPQNKEKPAMATVHPTHISSISGDVEMNRRDFYRDQRTTDVPSQSGGVSLAPSSSGGPSEIPSKQRRWTESDQIRTGVNEPGVVRGKKYFYSIL